MMEVRKQEVESLLDKYNRQASQLISILHDVQSQYNWTPKEIIIQISEGLGIPISHVYSVVSFYKVFRTEPRGRHVARICLGTACHVRGGDKIMQKAEDILGIKQGTTTEDKKFTLEKVNCLGCCALGPVMVVDGNYYGRLVPADVEGHLAKYE
jgi:NADH-quinone oxidoreductase subunit E